MGKFEVNPSNAMTISASSLTIYQVYYPSKDHSTFQVSNKKTNSLQQKNYVGPTANDQTKSKLMYKLASSPKITKPISKTKATHYETSANWRYKQAQISL